MTLIDIYADDSSLREYQKQSKLDIYKAWELSSSVLFQMPTGTGKTRVFSSIINDIQRISIKTRHRIGVLVLAHREELIEQIDESLGFKYHVAHGIIKSGFEPDDRFPVQVASVQTLHRRLENFDANRFDYIIIDEAHHALARTYKDICNKFPNAKLLGVTATPCRLGKGSLRSVFGTLVLSQGVSKFIEQGYLSRYKYYSISPTSSMQRKIDAIEDFAFDGDYSEKAMMSVCNTRKIRAGIVQAYLDYAKGKKGIIYTINQEHNNSICEEFQEIGVSIASIDSKTPSTKRKELVSQFRSGKIDVLCNVNIFSEGFDCPDVEFILLARPTCSLALYLQQVGRGLRPHPGKDDAIILDNVGSFNKFGLPSAKRQWRRHFEGINHLVRKGGEHTRIGTYTTSDLSEGEEKMELIFSSDSSDSQMNEQAGLYSSIMQTKEIFPLGLKSLLDDSPIKFTYFGHMLYKDKEEWLEDLESEIWNLEDDKSTDMENKFYEYYRFQYKGKYGLYHLKESLSKEESKILSGEVSIYSKIQMLLEPIYDEIGVPDSTDDSICCRDGKYGAIEGSSMREIVPFIYNSLIQFDYRTYICERYNKSGILSKDEVILPIEYDDIFPALDRSEYHSYIFCQKGHEITIYKVSYGELEALNGPFPIVAPISPSVCVCRVTRDLLGIASSNGDLISNLPMKYIFKIEESDQNTYYAKVNGGLFKLNDDWNIEEYIEESQVKELKSLAKWIHRSEYEISPNYVAKKKKKTKKKKAKQSEINTEVSGIKSVKQQYANVTKLFKHFFLVKNDKLYGLYNSDKEEFVFPIEYDSIVFNPGKMQLLLQKKRTMEIGLYGEIVSMPSMTVIGNRHGEYTIMHKQSSDEFFYKKNLLLEAPDIIWIKYNVYKVRDYNNKWGVISTESGRLDVIKPYVYSDIQWNDDKTKLKLFQEGKRPRTLNI